MITQSNQESTIYEQELIAEALEVLESLAAGQKLREVEIALGPGVDPGRAAQAWTVGTENTPLASVHVTWEQAFDLLRCEACGHEFAGNRLELCPYCGAEGVVIEPALPVSVGRWVTAAM